MDANDLIEELITDVPSGAEVILAKTPNCEYIFIYSLGNKKHRMRVLNPEEGEALALIYPADVNRLNPLPFAVMETELRKRLIDDILESV